MSTHDVPGHNPQNNDVLKMGCWAEAEDGSKIFVESTEGGRVVFQVFDLAENPIVEYRTAMAEKEFKDSFSWDPKRFSTQDDKGRKVPMAKWTWHDKTPFDFSFVIAHGAREGARDASASDTFDRAEAISRSIARRVAEALKLRAQQVDEAGIKHTLPRSDGDLVSRLRRAAEAALAELSRP